MIIIYLKLQSLSSQSNSLSQSISLKMMKIFLLESSRLAPGLSVMALRAMVSSTGNSGMRALTTRSLQGDSSSSSSSSSRSSSSNSSNGSSTINASSNISRSSRIINNNIINSSRSIIINPLSLSFASGPLRSFSTGAGSGAGSHDHSHHHPVAPTEAQISEILERVFEPAKMVVKDVSGGCGSMFDIYIESAKFKVNIICIYNNRIVH